MPDKKRRNSKAPKPSRPHVPGYGLPKGSKGLLPWKWAEQRLKKSHNYWITTVRPDGSPHVMVVWGLWLDGRFLFSTGSKSRKARNLAKNAHCVVSTEDAHEAVIVEGEAQPAGEAERKHLLTQYPRKYKWDMSAMADEPIFSVRPRVVFALWEKHFQSKFTRWTFE
jgi:pyridoxine/pyridoxamine 5'-phosphate oxidase